VKNNQIATSQYDEMKHLLNEEITNYKTQIKDLSIKSTQLSNDRNNNLYNSPSYDVKE